MKNLMQGTVLVVAMLSLAMLAEADELGSALQSHFAQEQGFTYMRYQRVDQMAADEFGSMRYLVMDFNLALADQNAVQQSVHAICSTVLKDIQLVRNLSDAGYDMISVSFDANSQFDCL